MRDKPRIGQGNIPARNINRNPIVLCEHNISLDADPAITGRAATDSAALVVVARQNALDMSDVRESPCLHLSRQAPADSYGKGVLGVITNVEQDNHGYTV